MTFQSIFPTENVCFSPSPWETNKPSQINTVPTGNIQAATLSSSPPRSWQAAQPPARDGNNFNNCPSLSSLKNFKFWDNWGTSQRTKCSSYCGVKISLHHCHPWWFGYGEEFGVLFSNEPNEKIVTAVPCSSKGNVTWMLLLLCSSPSDFIPERVDKFPANWISHLAIKSAFNTKESQLLTPRKFSIRPKYYSLNTEPGKVWMWCVGKPSIFLLQADFYYNSKCKHNNSSTVSSRENTDNKIMQGGIISYKLHLCCLLS